MCMAPCERVVSGSKRVRKTLHVHSQPSALCGGSGNCRGACPRKFLQKCVKESAVQRVATANKFCAGACVSERAGECARGWSVIVRTGRP